MNNHDSMEDDRDPSEQLAREDAEQRQWLDEREKDEEYMDKMFEYFIGGQHENQ